MASRPEVSLDDSRPAGPAIVVAGHICLDLIPRLVPGAPRRPRPGALDPVGPATLAIGGCVGNVGVALHRLGHRPTLVARIGDDPFGGILAGLVAAAVAPGSARLLVTPGAATSYSVISNRPGADRAIQHFPGVNDAFVAADVPDDVLRGAAVVHVGYPPLMAAMVADDGRELRRLLERAHAAGAVTSVDMAAVHLGPAGRGVRWRRLLERVLPEVDVFLPSFAEAAHLLRRPTRPGAGSPPDLDAVAALAAELVGLGAGVAGIKLGDGGLYVRGGAARRDGGGPGRLPAAWARRELWSPVFETQVVGTTGAGDATIAGLLHGLLAALPPEGVVTAACAVGGASTEALDGTSGVPPWPTIERRLGDGWRRRRATPGRGWTPSPADPGLWLGPDDATRARA